MVNAERATFSGLTGFVKKLVYPYLQHLHAVRRIEWAKIQLFLNIEPDDRILDLGCGKGFFCGYLRNKTDYVHGIDPLKKEIDTAHTVYPDISFLVGEGENLPYADERFDKVSSVSVLEHTTNDVQVVQEVYRVLKEKGVFALSVDALTSPFIGQSYLKYHTNQYKINHLYDKRRIYNLLSEAGFSNISSEYFFTSFLSFFIFRFGSFFHFKSLFFLAFPFIFPLLLVDDWLSKEKSYGIIMVIRAEKPG